MYTCTVVRTATLFEDGVLMATALGVSACIGVVVASTVVFWN
jgi:hypothetical protein